MGQTLSEPITAKESSYCQNELYRVGSSCMQGWRINMEDSHTHILSLPDDPGTAFFAVYDGHGGATVAQYAGKHLHKFVLKRPEYKDNVEKALQQVSAIHVFVYIASMIILTKFVILSILRMQAFLDIDYEMLYNESWGEQMAGSTAVVVLIKNNRLYCANAGDSRAVACINGRVETLSMDHKPNNEAESKRINEGGGWVEFNRVNGNLALSRALGDFVFKRNENKKPEDQIVTGKCVCVNSGHLYNKCFSAIFFFIIVSYFQLYYVHKIIHIKRNCQEIASTSTYSFSIPLVPLSYTQRIAARKLA